MHDRRYFLKSVAATALGMGLAGHVPPAVSQVPRREVSIGGRRVTVVDIQVLSANQYWWYRADPELARDIIRAQDDGFLPSYLSRTEVACDVRNNANCVNTKRPSEYLKDQILVDSMVFSDEALRHLVAEIGASQIVYGTDIPLFWPDTLDLILDATHLTDAEKEAIAGGNLVELLRIEA